jgi:acyl-coenzyme A synthetase/AMP-(fatty) acid ligase
VYLLDEASAKFPAVIARTLSDHRISVFYATPTSLTLLCEHGGLERRQLSPLRWVLFAGEVFPMPQLRSLMQKLPGSRFANLYGPTETNVCTFHILDRPPEDSDDSIPIGKTCEHLHVRITDDEGNEMPRGMTGEICVQGSNVFQGYWERPDLTERSRLPGLPDSYRTGDLGHMDAGGIIYFSGRHDHQVKIRGHRIELLGVESELSSHPDVGQAVVVVVDRPNGSRELAAFVCPKLDRQLSVEILQRHCQEKLPHQAIPATFTICRQLPVNSAGKVDRRHLKQESL